MYISEYEINYCIIIIVYVGYVYKREKKVEDK